MSKQESNEKLTKMMLGQAIEALEVIKKLQTNEDKQRQQWVALGYRVVDTSKCIVIAQNIAEWDRAWGIMRAYVLSKPPMSTYATVIGQDEPLPYD